MEVLGMDGMSWKNIFVSRISMNIIERNKENDIYRPRTICPGYTGAVTRSCIMNCYVATPSVWGNSTEICVSGNAEV